MHVGSSSAGINACEGRRAVSVLQPVLCKYTLHSDRKKQMDNFIAEQTFRDIGLICISFIQVIPCLRVIPLYLVVFPCSPD